MKPLLESQQFYDQPYAARDLGAFSSRFDNEILIVRFFIGSAYPQAAGFRNPHSQGIERKDDLLQNTRYSLTMTLQNRRTC